MQFHYVAYTLEAGIFKGRVEARSEDEARTELIGQGYKPLSVRKSTRLPSLDKVLPSLYQIKTGELIGFGRQASTMLASGANLLRVLEMIGAETPSRGLKKVLASIYERVSEGDEFTTALRQHPDVFDDVFISLVEVGEYTGRLAPALEQLADIMEQAHEAKQRAVKTMMMPLFLISTSLLMLGFMSFVALPPLLDTFESMGVEIPLLTRMMVGLTNGIVDYILYIAIGVVFTVVAYKLARRNRSLRYYLDFLKLRAPLLGSLILASELGRFSRIMSTLLENGVELSTALQLCISSSKNAALGRAWREADEGLMAGQRMASTLEKHKIVPSLFVELMAIGEESNSLARTTGELADAYEKRFQERISAILAVAEPVSTFAVGGVVLFMALSIMKPILSAASAVE